MYLTKILLPLFARHGDRIPQTTFDEVRKELTERFGGVTVFLRAPAAGMWEDGRGEIHRDEVVIFEVMTDNLDREWWRRYRRRLESAFDQESVVIRASVIETL